MALGKTKSRINQQQFEAVRERFGWCASWALWAPIQEKPKSGIGDLSLFEMPALTSTINHLHADVIFVGLNISRDDSRIAFSNFHSENRYGQDYKLRYALDGSPFLGGYMTDIVKGHKEVSSSKLMKALGDDRGIEAYNIKIFLEELDLLQTKDPLIVALGSAAHQILTRNFDSKFRIARIPHYAHLISPKIYRKQVLAALKEHA